MITPIRLSIVLLTLLAVVGCSRRRANPVEVTEHEVLVTVDNYEAEVVESDVPVLLDFSAVWCPPCQEMAPIIQDIAAETEGSLKVGIVDTDREDTQELSRAYTASSLPSFYIVIDGQPVASRSGSSSERDFRAWVDKYTKGRAAAGNE